MTARAGGGGAALTVNATPLVADPSGALVWPARRLVAVADLHLEKGSHFAARRRPLPPFDSAETLTRLEAVLARHRPRTVVCLGDSFHDVDAPGRLPPAAAARLDALTAAHDWIWIAGNHDPAPDAAPDARWGGRVAGELVLGGLVFRHAAAAGPVAGGEVSGHFHPKAAVRARGRRMSARCFVADGRRLILPAFGAYAGGLNVLAPPIRELLAAPFQVYLLARGRIVASAAGALTR